MRKLFIFTFFFLTTAMQSIAQPCFDKATIKSIMKRVADWQIANPNKGAEHDDLDWTHAAACWIGQSLQRKKTVTILITNGYYV